MDLAAKILWCFLVVTVVATPLGRGLQAQDGSVSKRTVDAVQSNSKPQLGEAATKAEGSLPAAMAALADRAATAFSKRDWVAARKAYKEMLSSEPENALAWANLGAVEQQAGQLDAAVECFEASTTFNPKLVQSWLALGTLLSARGDRYKALSCFSRAAHEDPLDPRAHNLLAIEAKNLGWRDMAVSELQRALELRPSYGLAHFNLATLYLDQTPPAILLAKRHYEQSLALGEPKDEVLERKLKAE
jgi:tetratricopeptide (TPR) repeat protein